jgi:hypothetical protein
MGESGWRRVEDPAPARQSGNARSRFSPRLQVLFGPEPIDLGRCDGASPCQPMLIGQNLEGLLVRALLRQCRSAVGRDFLQCSSGHMIPFVTPPLCLTHPKASSSNREGIGSKHRTFVVAGVVPDCAGVILSAALWSHGVTSEASCRLPCICSVGGMMPLTSDRLCLVVDDDSAIRSFIATLLYHPQDLRHGRGRR